MKSNVAFLEEIKNKLKGLKYYIVFKMKDNIKSTRSWSIKCRFVNLTDEVKIKKIYVDESNKLLFEVKDKYGIYGTIDPMSLSVEVLINIFETCFTDNKKLLKMFKRWK